MSPDSMVSWKEPWTRRQEVHWWAHQPTGSVTSLAISLLLTRKGGTLSPLWGQVAGTGPVCEFFFLLGPRGQLPGLLPDTPLIPP